VKKHILSKAIAAALLGTVILPITQDVEATFINDDVIVTWDIAGSVASSTSIADGHLEILNYPADFSPTTAPISGANTYVQMPAGSLDVVYNLGVYDVT